MRARLPVYLLFSFLAFGACGGRLIQGGGDDGGGSNTGASPGNGGSFSQAATSSVGATSNRGGRSGGGGTVATGGMFSAGTSAGGGVPFAGATSMGGGCACPAVPCPPGYATVPNATGCCFHCESPCSNVACPGIACGSGSHLEIPPGQCCPACIKDSCDVQRAGYQALRQQLIEKYSTYGCMTNNDCTVYYEKNQCGVGCGIPMAIAAIDNLDSNLQSYAQSSCSPNCMYPVLPCEPPAQPICFRGMCQ